MMDGDDTLNRKLRYYSHLITFENMSTYATPSNLLHNLISAIFGITDLFVAYQKKVLETVRDPFELLLQFAVKYSQFQNTIIGM